MAAQPSFSGGFHQTVHFSAVMPVKRMGPSTGPGVSMWNQKEEHCQKLYINVMPGVCYLVSRQHSRTLHSDVDISFLGTRVVLGLYSVDATVVPVGVTDENAAGANAGGNLNVHHSPLVDLFAILVPDNLGDGPPSDPAAELNVLSGPQSQHLVRRPFDLRGNYRCRENTPVMNWHSQR